MATLCSPLAESVALTEQEYTPVPPCPEASGAVSNDRIEPRFTWPQLGEIPGWVQPTIGALTRIMELAPNWDTYGSQPVQSVLAGRAVDILSRVMEQNSPPPSIVALADGGLQMEWHLRDQDIEIVVAADEPPTYFYRSRDGEIEEGTPSADYARLSSIIEGLH